ncbi:MAG: sulfite exporter TauE/SafE family protein [Bacteroidales bacterium]|nr:sulfite exporter TauE/SafE family protein [Bacteroidales bacterium]
MNESIKLLSATAVSIAFMHTLLGPDHYLPFIVLSEAKKWSTKKTMLITLLCGMGHVLSSVLLGFIGIAAGVALSKLVGIEEVRGSIAAWLFIVFGLIYMIISIYKLHKNKEHTHSHFGVENSHIDGSNPDEVIKTTPWIIFLIFVFGPCEPLIPLVMYPAAQSDIKGVIWVSLLFSLVTIATMMTIVFIFKMGFSKITLKSIEKYNNVIAGAVIFLAGMAIQFLGL